MTAGLPRGFFLRLEFQSAIRTVHITVAHHGRALPPCADPIMKPSRVRFGVLAFVCVLSMITYLDRASFPNLQGFVLKSLGKNEISQLKLALTAFQLAYALFEVPTGWLGDTFGPRKTLIRIVLWWSFFIAVTGLVGLVRGVVAFGSPLPESTLYGLWMLV